MNGRFPVFSSAAALSDEASQRGIDLVVQEPNLHDLDAIASWLLRPRADSIDAGVFLAGWNLYGDVASSLGSHLNDRTVRYHELYDKLFQWGGPAWAIGRREQDHTAWTPEEVLLLANLLSRGLEMFSANLVRR